MPWTTQAWRPILLFLTFLSITLAASPTSFCKCTCFQSSTLIPLNTPHEASPPPSSTFNTTLPPPTTNGKTCNDCTKKFCLGYNLPICADAAEENVLTTCFQRDSVKDQVVIYVFIMGTVGLLGWAGMKPAWERWRSRGRYEAVGGRG